MSLSPAADPSNRPAEVLPNVIPFLEDAREQLASTPHFGALASVLEGDRPFTSRLEYVRNQADLLYRLKIRVEGLGLGSSGNLPAADAAGQNPWVSLQGFSGLEICQAWAVLLNAGHLFGTFATERPLLFVLDRELPVRDHFVRAITPGGTGGEPSLRTHVRKELDRAQLYSFHYLLALWRIRESGPTVLTGTHLNQARLLLQAYLVPPNEKLRRLKGIFRRIRTLSYLQLHAALRTAAHQIRDVVDTDLDKLFPTDALPEADWIAASLWDMYQAMDHADAETLFASSKAAAEVLAHNEQLKRWWTASAAAADSKIDALFFEPSDWPSSNRKRVSHVLQLRAPSSVGWFHEVRHWLRDDEQRDPWGNSEFLITPSFNDDTVQIDLYAPEEGITARTLEHVVRQLSRPFASNVGTKLDQALWMSTARLIARSFEASLTTPHRLRLSPVPAERGHAGYAVAGSTYEFIRGKIKRFLAVSSDEQRAKELRQLIAVADDVVGWRVPAIAMLANAEIMRTESGRTTAVTDLDGLIGYFAEGQLHWLIVETKKSGSGDGETQLRTGLFSALLAAPSSEISVRTFGGDETWYVTIPAGALRCR